MINSRKRSVVGLTALLLLGTAGGACAQVDEPGPIVDAQPKPIHVRPGARSARHGAGSINEVQPQNVRMLQKAAEMPMNAENEHRVKSLDVLAEDMFKKGRYNDALVHWQEAYGMSIEMKYSQGQGKALTGMCKVYLTQGKFVKAKVLGENAVEVLSAINDQADLGKARIALAQAYFGLDNALWGVKQLELAMRHLIDQPKSDPAEAANLMRMSGGILLSVKKIIPSIRFFQESAKYSEEANDLPAALYMRSKLASLMCEVGFYVAAKEEAEKGIKIAERAKNDRAMVSALATMANTQYMLGEYSDANATYLKAYQLAGKMDEKVLGKEAKSTLMMGYAFSLIGTGESEKAEKLLTSILPFFERDGKHYEHTQCLNALGVLMANKDEPFKALPYFERAIDVHTSIKPAQTRMQMMLLHNAAAAEYRCGKYRESLNHLRTIMPLFDRHKDDYQLIKCRTLVSLAEVSYKISENDKAKEYASQALVMGQKYQDDASLWRVYTLQAQMELASHETDKAKASLENALSHFRSPQAGYFPSAEYLTFTSSRRALGQQLVALVASQGMTEKGLIAAEQLKEEEIINTWIRKGVPVKADDRDIYIDLVNQRAHIHAAENSTTPDRLTKEWASWLSRFSEVARKNKSLANLIAPYPTTIEEIINGVRAKKVTVVEYLVGEKSSVAFTIDPIGRISATVLPVGEDKLVNQVNSLILPRTADSDGEVSDRATLQALYKELLPAPVMNFMPKTPDKQIVIVPDSVLYNLPFSALVDEQGKYFVEGHTLSLATSMRAMLDSTPNQPGRLSVLVALNSDPDEQSESSQILTAVEPDPVVTLSTQSSDLSELQRVSEGKAVVHLATAIPFTGENPSKAKLPFANAQGEVTADNTAGRLFELTIPNDLVFLSASSISGKDQEGQAVQVVGRGLGYAGARNVMMSLWNQPCDARSLEIANFYKNKKRGMSDAQSLRQAQLLALTSDRSPKAWAAFQLLGPGM